MIEASEEFECRILNALQQGDKTQTELLEACQCGSVSRLFASLNALQACHAVGFYFNGEGFIVFTLQQVPRLRWS